MSYNADLDFYVKSCSTLETEARNLLNQVSSAEGNEKRSLLRTIDTKVSKAREFVTSIQLDIGDLTNEDMISHYTRLGEEHDEVVRLLEEDSREASRSAQREEVAASQGLTPQDLMNKSLSLQKEQSKSLDNSLYTISQIQAVGGETLDEIARQKEQINSVSSNLNEMDSELARAKKIMKVMLTRAAGDCCVRVLAILVILAVIAVIIVEAVAPGTMKKQTDGWFAGGEVGEGDTQPSATPTQGK
jgi:hypothetical protein